MTSDPKTSSSTVTASSFAPQRDCGTLLRILAKLDALVIRVNAWMKSQGIDDADLNGEQVTLLDGHNNNLNDYQIFTKDDIDKATSENDVPTLVSALNSRLSELDNKMAAILSVQASTCQQELVRKQQDAIRQQLSLVIRDVERKFAMSISGGGFGSQGRNSKNSINVNDIDNHHGAAVAVVKEQNSNLNLKGTGSAASNNSYIRASQAQAQRKSSKTESQISNGNRSSRNSNSSSAVNSSTVAAAVNRLTTSRSSQRQTQSQSQTQNQSAVTESSITISTMQQRQKGPSGSNRNSNSNSRITSPRGPSQVVNNGRTGSRSPRGTKQSQTNGANGSTSQRVSAQSQIQEDQFKQNVNPATLAAVTAAAQLVNQNINSLQNLQQNHNNVKILPPSTSSESYDNHTVNMENQIQNLNQNESPKIFDFSQIEKMDTTATSVQGLGYQGNYNIENVTLDSDNSNSYSGPMHGSTNNNNSYSGNDSSSQIFGQSQIQNFSTSKLKPSTLINNIGLPGLNLNQQQTNTINHNQSNSSIRVQSPVPQPNLLSFGIQMGRQSQGPLLSPRHTNGQTQNNILNLNMINQGQNIMNQVQNPQVNQIQTNVSQTTQENQNRYAESYQEFYNYPVFRNVEESQIQNSMQNQTQPQQFQSTVAAQTRAQSIGPTPLSTNFATNTTANLQPNQQNLASPLSALNMTAPMTMSNFSQLSNPFANVASNISSNQNLLSNGPTQTVPFQQQPLTIGIQQPPSSGRLVTRDLLAEPVRPETWLRTLAPWEIWEMNNQANLKTQTSTSHNDSTSLKNSDSPISLESKLLTWLNDANSNPNGQNFNDTRSWNPDQIKKVADFARKNDLINQNDYDVGQIYAKYVEYQIDEAEKAETSGGKSRFGGWFG